MSTTFDITLTDGTSESVADADAYQQEQSMTTFFRNDAGRQAVDSWSVRIASFRTERIAVIRRVDQPESVGQGEVTRLRSA